jgi:hypothetical protein
MQIGLLKVNYYFSSGILYISISDIPFSGHSPIEYLGACGHFLYFQWNMIPEDLHRLAKPVPGDTPANRIESLDELIYFLSGRLEIHGLFYFKRSGEKFGSSASRCEIKPISMGNLILNAGSFQRNPLAEFGAWNSVIW